MSGLEVENLPWTLVDGLHVGEFPDRTAMGRAAADDVAAEMVRCLDRQPSIRMVFAAAPSQNEFLAALCEHDELDWSRVVAFQMDEYIGLSPTHPSAFQSYLDAHLFRKVQPKVVHRMGVDESPQVACDRYASLIQAAPIDIVCLGIGENGHIAFNDPGVALFEDPEVIKPVLLDQACRTQQVHDGCFPSLAQVPTHAITLTIPTLFGGRALFCVVPGSNKKQAVTETLTQPISERCPASILRRHPNCRLYLDPDAAGDSYHWLA